MCGKHYINSSRQRPVVCFDYFVCFEGGRAGSVTPGEREAVQGDEGHPRQTGERTHVQAPIVA